MSTNESGRLTGLAFLSLLATACPDEGAPAMPADAGSEPDAGRWEDGGEPTFDAGERDAGEPMRDAGLDGAAPDGSAPEGGTTERDGGPIDPCAVIDCADQTPVCVEGRCVECTSASGERCGDDQVCDPVTNRCDSPATPFALDCANLPATGACQGGPREVLLVMERGGMVLMFDPADGHYLGVFKRAVPGFSQTFWTVTQGSDQCIWTTSSGQRGVERWETDGSYKDAIIPVETYFDGQTDLVEGSRGLAFTEDRVYVAARGADSTSRVLAFELAKLTAPEAHPDRASHFETVLDDGSSVDSLLVLGDGSLVITNSLTERIERIPADGSERRILSGPVEDYSAMTQLAYAGSGEVLAGDSWNGVLYKLQIDTEMWEELTPAGSEPSALYGVARLHDGKTLYAARGEIEALDWESTQPTGQHASLFDELAITSREFRYVGRACLPKEVVEARSTVDPELEDCEEPAGAAALRVDFETGDFSGSGADRQYEGFFVQPFAGVTVELDTLGANGTKKSLKITNGSDALSPLFPEPSGVAREFEPGLRPSYIGYYLRVEQDGSQEEYTGYMTLGRQPDAALESIYVSTGELTTQNSFVGEGVEASEWLRVQLRDIDWNERTYDLYLNCARVADDVPFHVDAGSELTRMELWNLNPGIEDWPVSAAWFDEIVVK